MAGVPQNFQSVSNVLASYDFVDIASGTGFINLYAGTTVDLRMMSNNSFYSDTIAEPEASGNAGAAALVFDHDYDILLNRPLDLKGTGIVNVPTYVTAAGATSTAHIYATVILRKWDGSTESDIVTNVGRDYGVTAAAGVQAFMMFATDLIIPLTHFKKGETIRVTIKLYAYTSGTSDAYAVTYAHDPMNRTFDPSGAVPSKLVFQMPVRLNL